MATITSKKNKSKYSLKLTGPAMIEHVTELKNELVKYLSKSETVEFDLEEVTSADVSFLQLLESLCKTSHTEGKSIEVVRDSPSLRRLFAETGFFRQQHCVFFPDKPCIFHNRKPGEEGR